VESTLINNKIDECTSTTSAAHRSISNLLIIIVIIPAKQPIVIVFTFLLDPFDLTRLIFRFNPCVDLALILVSRFDFRG